MAYLASDIRRSSASNRRQAIWANIAAFGALAFVIALLLLGPGGAPEPETGQAGLSQTQSRPNG